MSAYEPYVGPRPFESTVDDISRFFGREEEAFQIVSLVTAHPAVVVYAQSGAGKSSLINARLVPLLSQDGFDVLPPARISCAAESAAIGSHASVYVLNALSSWSVSQDRRDLAQQSMAEYLSRRERPVGADGLAAPRIVIFDQFEELFTFAAERRSERRVFFEQVRDALDSSPVVLQPDDIENAAELIKRLGQPANDLDKHVRDALAPDVQKFLQNGQGAEGKARDALILGLNRLLQGSSLYRAASASADFGPAIQSRLEKVPVRDPLRLNRVALETAFPGIFRKRIDGDTFLRVLFVMREDYIAELDPYASILPGGLRARFRLERLRERAALKAIKDPLKRTKRFYGEGVAESLVQDLLSVTVEIPGGGTTTIQEEFVEPVQLQVVCQNLWEGLPDDVLEIRREHLESSADVDQALSSFYEKCLERVAGQSQLTEGELRRWFGEILITEAGTRGTVFRGETETAGLGNAVIDTLDKMHLIRREIRGRGSWYELTHDRFIEPIRRSNRQWLASRLTADQKRQELHRKSNLWTKSGRARDGLLRDVELLEAEQWLGSPVAIELGVDEPVAAFVHASRLAEDDANQQLELVRTRELASEQGRRAQAEKQRAQLMRVALLTVAFLLAVAVFAAFDALKQGAAAQEATDRARQSEARAVVDAANAKVAEAQAKTERAKSEQKEKEANEAKSLAEEGQIRSESSRLSAKALLAGQSDPELGILLANEAVRLSYSKDGENSLRQALEASLLRNMLRLGPPDDGLVTCVTRSPDGRSIAVASDSGEVRIWEPQSGRTRILSPAHKDEAGCAAFSPRGDRLATVSEDSTTRVWDVASGKPLHTLTGHAAGVHLAVFSPDGATLATEAADRSGIVWDLSTGKPLFKAEDLSGTVAAMAFSPDGRWIATETSSGAVVRNATSGQIVVKFSLGDDVSALQFTKDPGILLTASTDGSVHRWEVPSGKVIREIRRSMVEGAISAFGHLGQLGMSVDSNGRIQVWHTETGRILNELTDGPRSAVGIAFSADDRAAVIASEDGTLTVLATQSEDRLVIKAHSNGVTRAHFTLDGQSIVSAGEDNSVRLWDLSGFWKSTRILDEDRIEFAAPVDVARKESSPGNQTLSYLDVRIDNELTSLRLRNAPDRVLASRIARVSTDSTRKPFVIFADGSGSIVWNRSLQTYRPLAVELQKIQWVIVRDGHPVLVSNIDGTMTVHSRATGAVASTLAERRKVLRASGVLGRKAERVLTIDAGNLCEVWDASTGRKVDQFSLNLPKSRIGPITMDSFGVSVAVGFDNEVRVYQRHSGLYLPVPQARTQALEFSDDGKWLFVASAGGIESYPYERFAPYSEILKLVQQRVFRPLTAEERRR